MGRAPRTQNRERKLAYVRGPWEYCKHCKSLSFPRLGKPFRLWDGLSEGSRNDLSQSERSVEGLGKKRKRQQATDDNEPAAFKSEWTEESP